MHGHLENDIRIYLLINIAKLEFRVVPGVSIVLHYFESIHHWLPRSVTCVWGAC